MTASELIHNDSPYIIGLAGPTGSGKSTLAYRIQDMLPDKVAVVHMDDYFIPEEDMPKLAGYSNWDDPKSVNHRQLTADLSKLTDNKSITVDTKSARLNPDYYKTYQYKTVEIKPKPLIIVEGFLLLHFPELRRYLNKGIYLDAPFDVHNERRMHPAAEEYRQKVIKTMAEKYVLPSAVHADLVVDMVENNEQQVFQQVAELIPKHLIGAKKK